MKIKYLLFILFMTQSLLSQQTPPSCPPDPNINTEQFCEEGKGIQTNPEDIQNNECPDLKNNFDWRAQTSSSPEHYNVVGPNSSDFQIRNPFTGPADAFYFDFVTAQQGSNYQPEDGWELLKVDFGTYGNIDVNNIPGWYPDMPSGTNPKLPYMMLYNKYTGTLRFFGSLLDPHNTYKTIEVELRIPSQSPLAPQPPHVNSYQSPLKATNLLSIQGKSVQPLDQETDESALSVFVKYTNNPNNFFWFDVPVAYDPCICNNRVQLDVSFKFVQEADVNITGSLTGDIQTQNQGQGNFAVISETFPKVLAAGISTAAAIKSGGAVINFRAFTTLIDIFKVNASTQTLDNLSALQNLLQCTSDWAHVMRDNMPFVPTSERQKWKAANDVLDAHTTFLTSLASGCNSKDNAATTITGKIEASGTVTQTDVITGTRINMALPGSKWNDFDLQLNDYPDGNGKVVPSYPTYNERLGVLAMLETPKINLHVHRIDIGGGWYFRVNKISLKAPLKYAINPKTNIDIDNSLIQVRYVIRDESDDLTYKDEWQDLEYFKNQWSDLNYFSQYMENTLYPISSNFTSIENFMNLPMIFTCNDVSVNDKIFLQIRILLFSSDIGADGNNESYSVMTFPVEIDQTNSYDFEPIYDPSLISENTLANHDMYDGVRHFSFHEEEGVFNIDQTFTENKVFMFDNYVEISAKLSSTNNKQVKIYSTKRINVLPGAEIDPNIELIIGYPFEKYPMPPATFEEASGFCASNKYKAQDFSPQARFAEQKEYQRQAESIKKQKEVKMKIHPNPNNGHFTIGFTKPIGTNSEITITSVSGENVYHQIFNDTHSSIDINVAHLSNGMYFVTFDDGINRLSQKIILNK